MSYREESDGTVTLTLSRDDYELVLMALGIAIGCASRDGVPIQSWLELTNRINEGNPNYTPYKRKAGSNDHEHDHE